MQTRKTPTRIIRKERRHFYDDRGRPRGHNEFLCDDDKWYLFRQLAALLSVSVKTLYNRKKQYGLYSKELLSPDHGNTGNFLKEETGWDRTKCMRGYALCKNYSACSAARLGLATDTPDGGRVGVWEDRENTDECYVDAAVG